MTSDTVEFTVYRKLQRAVRKEDLVAQKTICGRIKSAIQNQNDADATDAVLIAALDPDLSILEILLNNIGDDCLQVKYSDGDSIVHLAAMYQGSKSAAAALEMLTQKLGKDCLKIPGFHNRTAAHYAACNQKDPSALIWLLERPAGILESNAFLAPDTENTCAFHYAFQYQSADTVKQLVNKLEPDFIKVPGRFNRTVAHYAAWNEIDPTVLFWAIKFETKTLNRIESINIRDSNGLNCFHMCSLNHKHGASIFSKLTKIMEFESEEVAINRFFDNERRNPLFIACLAKNFNFINSEFVNLKTQQCTDSNGNTLLHALFLIFEPGISTYVDSEELFKAVTRFSKEGISIAAENAMKRNFLLASEISDFSLNEILKNLARPELKARFKELQRNSEGLHAAHIFCSRYNIKTLEAALCQLWGLTPDDLLKSKVSDCPLKNATCLHFACEAGHKENIKYLMSKDGIQVTDLTDSGLTCIDFACNKGKLHVLLEVAVEGKDLSELLCHVDVPSRALQLPDLQSAKNLLNQFIDPALRSNIEKDRSAQLMTGTSKTNEASGETPEVKMLFRSLELDSSELLRSLIALKIPIKDMDRELRKYLQELKFDDKDSNQRRSLRRLDQLQSELKDSKASFSLTDCMIYFSKDRLLTDLMLLPQYDIIPETLRLLIHLRPRIELMKSE